jgi:hypothetical protein
VFAAHRWRDSQPVKLSATQAAGEIARSLARSLRWLQKLPSGRDASVKTHGSMADMFSW